MLRSELDLIQNEFDKNCLKLTNARSEINRKWSLGEYNLETYLNENNKLIYVIAKYEHEPDNLIRIIQYSSLEEFKLENKISLEMQKKFHYYIREIELWNKNEFDNLTKSNVL